MLVYPKVAKLENGFNCHSLESALEIISSLGCQGVAITLDNYTLNPWNSDLNTELDLVTSVSINIRYPVSLRRGPDFSQPPA